MFTYFDNDIEINLDLIESLSNFKAEFNINCLSIHLVDNKKIYNVEEIGTEIIDSAFSSQIIQNNNIISLACDSLKPVYHLVEGDDTIVPINKNFIEEVCIPIKVEKHKDIIVCVYFGFTNKTKDIPELLSLFFL